MIKYFLIFIGCLSQCYAAASDPLLSGSGQAFRVVVPGASHMNEGDAYRSNSPRSEASSEAFSEEAEREERQIRQKEIDYAFQWVKGAICVGGITGIAVGIYLAVKCGIIS